jgi:hypothetical protein
VYAWVNTSVQSANSLMMRLTIFSLQNFIVDGK